VRQYNKTKWNKINRKLLLAAGAKEWSLLAGEQCCRGAEELRGGEARRGEEREQVWPRR